MQKHEWIESYELIDLIGPGGTAEVHYAHHHIETGKEVEEVEEVAIKILHEFISNRDPEIQKRFLEQVTILKALDHPHIVKVIEVLFTDTKLHGGTRPCIVMPYVPGGTLRKRLNDENFLPLDTIRSYARQLADALSYAHNKGIIHSDVKPENILLDKDGDHLFLADFGIARIVSETFSSTNVTSQGSSGTDVYMAPEQFTEKGSRRSDQYALAIIIYECLCGKPPFERANRKGLREQHLHDPVPSLQKACRARGRNISKNTERVILKALAKKKQQRYASVQEFASALDRALTREIEPKTLIGYDNAAGIGVVSGILVGIGMLIVYLTAPVDVPQQFSIGEKILSNFLELLYIVCALVGLGYVLAGLITRKPRHGVIALSFLMGVSIFFFAQFFLSRPLFTLAGQLRLLEFFSLIPVGAVIGFLLAIGVASLFIWYVNKRRQL